MKNSMYTGASILMYNLDNDNAAALEMLCIKLGIEIRHVKLAEYLQTIGALAELPDMQLSEEVYTDRGFYETIMVMKNFTAGSVIDFNDRLKRNKHVNHIDLQTVLTPKIAKMNGIELCEYLLQGKEPKKEPDLTFAEVKAKMQTPSTMSLFRRFGGKNK